MAKTQKEFEEDIYRGLAHLMTVAKKSDMEDDHPRIIMLESFLMGMANALFVESEEIPETFRKAGRAVVKRLIGK